MTEIAIGVFGIAGRSHSTQRWRRLAVHILILAALAAAVVARRQDALVHPQFYAEDGTSWFADAYNLSPLHALSLPLGGYYTFFQRAVALLVAPLGVDRAPMIFAVIGFGMQVLPAAFFISPRMRSVVQKDSTRAWLAALYVVIPARELGGNLTNTQWDLMILAFLVIFAAPPAGRIWRAFDLVALILSGLTGPYALFLLPIAALHWRSRVPRWRMLQIAVMAACCAVQLGVMAYLHLHGSSRTAAGPGWSVGDIGVILTNQVLATVSGVGLAGQAQALAWTIAGLVVVILVAVAARGPNALRWFTILAASLAVSGMVSPYDARPVKAPWQELMGGGGSRYFYALILALAFSLAWLAFRSPRRFIATSSICLLAGFCWLAVTHWQYSPYTVASPMQYGQVLGEARSGTVVRIPINPKGWTMTLVRR